MGLFLLVFSIFLGKLVYGELLITEIMYDPSTEMGSDYDLEWIEAYNNGSGLVNASGFTINGKKVSGGTISPQTYFIITKKLFSEKNQSKSSSFEAFYGNNDGIWDTFDGNYPALDAEAFSLGNANGLVVLSKGLISVKANYSKSMGGDGNGHSLEWVNGEWLESKELYGTPGKKNTADNTANLFLEKSNDVLLTIYLNEKLFTYQNYDDLFKIQFLDKKNCSVSDSIKVKYILKDESNQTILNEQFLKEEIGCSTYSQTGELKLEKEGTYTLCGEIISASVADFNLDNNKVCQEIKVIDTSKIPCDLSLGIETKELFYAYPEGIGFDFSLNSEEFPFSITYWVEDLFGNKLKEKYTTTNTNKKSFTPDIDEEDRVVFLKAEMETVCNDTNLSNNLAEKMLILTRPGLGKEIGAGGTPSQNQSDLSQIEIVKVSADVSDLVKAELDLYRGDTAKYSISVYMKQKGKKVSEIFKINLKNKFTSYHLVVPLSLKSKAKLKSEELTLVVEGLGLSEEKDFELKNIPSSENEADLTTSTKAGDSTEKTNPKLTYEIIEKPAAINPGEEFAINLDFKGDEKEHSVLVYGYLYRGSKCYSCCEDCDEVLERDANKIEFGLEAGEEKKVELPFKADGKLEAGEYKLKVKIKVDGQKIEKELTETILVKEESQEKNACVPVYSSGITGNKRITSSTEEKITAESSGVVVYESSSEKAKHLTAYILIIALGMVLVVLGWRR